MGTTKIELYSQENNKLASLFKVLAHPARLAILQHVIDQKACICNDLAEELGLAQATISQHLRELKSVRLLRGSIDGKSVCYCIDPDKWNEIQSIIHQFFDQSIPITNCK
jgi:DNA-binding transcriptional ArsR family regulator